MTKYAELIARLEAAEVGSRDLDVGLACLLEKSTKLIEGHANKIHAVKIGDRWVSLPHYSTSLDAALALAERALPGCRCIAERDHDGTGWACVRASEDADRFMTDANTPALALCIAILKALEAKQ